jgi:hypothetical protein
VPQSISEPHGSLASWRAIEEPYLKYGLSELLSESNGRKESSRLATRENAIVASKALAVHWSNTNRITVCQSHTYAYAYLQMNTIHMYEDMSDVKM